MANTDQRNTIIRILQVLTNFTDSNNCLTSNEIVEKLENLYNIKIERRAVERKIHSLQECGYEIERKRSKTAGESGWYLNEREFDDSELLFLMKKVVFSKSIKENYAVELVKKLCNLGSVNLKNNNKEIFRVKNTQHSTAINSPAYFNNFETIDSAIAKSKQIEFKYGSFLLNGSVSFDGATPKIVNPFMIVSANDRFYLIATKKGETTPTHYRLDKIGEVVMLTSPREENSSLKGQKLETYIAEHSKMFAGASISVTIKIEKGLIGHLIDAFGLNFKQVDEDSNNYYIELKTNENDAFYWALQFSEVAEIIKPESLRERIRNAIEELRVRYSELDTDKFATALDSAKRNGSLNLAGINFNNVNYGELNNLNNIRSVTLADNKINKIDFIQNYKQNLSVLSIQNNNLTNLNDLSGLRVRKLELKSLPLLDLNALKSVKFIEDLELNSLEKVTNFNVLKELKNLRYLKVYYCREQVVSVINELTGLKEITVTKEIYDKLDFDKIKANNANVKIINSIAAKLLKYVREAGVGEEFPKNVLHDAFGYGKKFVGDKDKYLSEIDKMFNKLLEDERRFANLWYKECYTAKDIADISGISIEEVGRITSVISQKLALKKYNGALSKYVEDDVHIFPRRCVEENG